MPRTGWTPSIVPNADDQNVYIVVDDFGRNGRAYRETDVERADLEAVIMDMLEGQYQNPVRVVGFNPRKSGPKTYRATLPRNCASAASAGPRVPFFLQDFVDQYEGRYHDIQLPLPMRLV